MIIKRHYNFLVFGENLNTAMSKDDIEQTIQDKLNEEFDNSLKFNYFKITPTEIVFVFYRDKDYLLDDDWLVDVDMHLLTGLPKDYFRPDRMDKPYFNCLIPMEKDYYIPFSECIEVYERLMDEKGNDFEEANIDFDNEKLLVRIIF